MRDGEIALCFFGGLFGVIFVPLALALLFQRVPKAEMRRRLLRDGERCGECGGKGYLFRDLLYGDCMTDLCGGCRGNGWVKKGVKA